MKFLERIPRFDSGELQPWCRRHPVLTRMWLVFLLLTGPFVWVCSTLWKERREVIDFLKQAGSALFLPWEDLT